MTSNRSFFSDARNISSVNPGKRLEEVRRMMQQNAVIPSYSASGYRIQHREENMDGDAHHWNPTSSSNWDRWIGITPRDKLMAEK
jgi:hypothetical protein